MSNQIKLIFIILFACCMTIWAKSVMTIIDDDTSNSHAIETVKGIADRHQIKVTFGVIAQRIENNPDMVKQLLEYQEEGHEMASHSYSHLASVWSRKETNGNLLAKMEEDLVKADGILRKNGFHPSAFIYPYGKFHGKEYRGKIIDMVQKYYPVAFNSRGGVNYPADTSFGYVGRFPMRSHNHLSMVKLQIRRAVRKEDCWFVVLTHSGMTNFSSSDLEEIIEYGKKQGMDFMTATEALRFWQQNGWQSISNDKLQDYTLFDEAWDFLLMHCFYVLIIFVIFVLFLITVYILIKRYIKKTRSLHHG